jgi:hypothetical protein
MFKTWLWISAALAACGSNRPPGANGGGLDAGFDAGADSIRAAAGPGRIDPENVAPPSAKVTNLTWKDSHGADRTAVLDAYLYQYDFSFAGGMPDPAQIVARSANDDAEGHAGFGYVVSHTDANGNSPFGKANAPTRVQSLVFAGGHHAIHRVELIYDRDKEPGGNGIKIPVVIDWFVATGRDHPVWAVTYRMDAATNPNLVDFDTYRMDTRGPYGSLNWDGAATRAAGDFIGGVAFGDFALKFSTSDAKLTLDSPWTYDQPNTVPFAEAWTANVNAAMGIVRTIPGDKTMGYADRVVGRERGATSAGAYPDKRNCAAFGDPRSYSMPCVSGWPYQLMNYDWDPSSGKAIGQAHRLGLALRVAGRIELRILRFVGGRRRARRSLLRGVRGARTQVPVRRGRRVRSAGGRRADARGRRGTRLRDDHRRGSRFARLPDRARSGRRPAEGHRQWLRRHLCGVHDRRCRQPAGLHLHAGSRAGGEESRLPDPGLHLDRRSRSRGRRHPGRRQLWRSRLRRLCVARCRRQRAVDHAPSHRNRGHGDHHRRTMIGGPAGGAEALTHQRGRHDPVPFAFDHCLIDPDVR